jgi:DNA-binding Xre family transcriptional regulator
VADTAPINGGPLNRSSTDLHRRPVVRIAGAQRLAVHQVDGKTLDALCAAFKVGPGELLEWVPDQKGKRG